MKQDEGPNLMEADNSIFEESTAMERGNMANVDCLECYCPGEMVDETEMLNGKRVAQTVGCHC